MAENPDITHQIMEAPFVVGQGVGTSRLIYAVGLARSRRGLRDLEVFVLLRNKFIYPSSGSGRSHCVHWNNEKGVHQAPPKQKIKQYRCLANTDVKRQQI
ncbi:hypothetical protein MTP99_016143 [Tenebrio molitor]|jgi:hypothetical protein|nr:hypothetical protein MTP99_016143 [Tenebrio molitor]